MARRASHRNPARLHRNPARSDRNPAPPRRRRGVATLDYVLLMGVVLPLAGFVMWAAPRIMNLVYEMTCVLISWPFL